MVDNPPASLISPPPKHTSDQNRLLWEFSKTGFLIVSLTFALSIVGMLAFTRRSEAMDSFSAILGTTNPLTFGGLLTGVVAASGLYYAIERDRGNRLSFSEGSGLQAIILSAALIAAILNAVWEYMRAVAGLYDFRQKTYRESLDNCAKKSISEDACPASRADITTVDLLSTWFSPNVLIVTFVSAAVIATLLVLVALSKPDLLQLGNQARIVSQRIEKRAQATAFVTSLYEDVGDFRTVFDQKYLWRSRAGRFIALLILFWAVSYVIPPSDHPDPEIPTRFFFIFLGLFSTMPLTCAFREHFRYVLSFGLLTDRATSYYYLILMGFVSAGAVVVGFAFSFVTGLLLSVWSIIVCTRHIFSIKRITSYQQAATSKKAK